MAIGTKIEEYNSCRCMKVMVPYSMNPHFVGRGQILDQLKEKFALSDNGSRNKPQSRAALFGLGGVG